MQITSVELRNIKNHADASWTFEPGVIAICGPNGAGKTTILEAIAWALFDHLDYNRDDFVRRGTKKGQVSIGFRSSADEREYIVTRDTSGGYFVYDPDTKVRLVEQKNQVLPFLRQHIGVEPEADLATLFKTTIGVPQGTFTYDFTLAPTPRKKVFDQILKVEEYRQASDNLRDTLRHIEGRISETDRNLAAAEGELKQYDEVRQQHDETAARLRGLEADLHAAGAERDHAAQELEKFAALQERITTQRNEAERLRVRLEFTRNQLAAAQAGLRAAQAASAVIAAARTGYENYQTATATLSELETQRRKRDQLREQSASIERELIAARVQSERSREKLSEVAQAKVTTQELSAAVGEQLALENRLAELREARGEAQNIRRSLDAQERDLERLRQRYTEISKSVEAAETQKEKAERAGTLEDERMALNLEIQQKSAALSQYQVRRDHLVSLGTELERLDRELAAIRQEVIRLAAQSEATARLSACETQQQQEAERLAQLRAEVARDAEMIAALESGGVCPLLTEKCLNLKPGESLDSRFRTGLEQRRADIATLTQNAAPLAAEIKQLRVVAADLARLPGLRAEETRLVSARDEQQQRLSALESETALGATVTEAEIGQLNNKLLGLESLLREAREAQQKYSQVEVLKRELKSLRDEGSTKRNEHDELAKRLAQLSDLETQLAATQQALAALNDPRGRVAALAQLVAREDELQRAAEEAERSVTVILTRQNQINDQLQPFATLDDQLAQASALRLASERDYQAFIANEKIAATLSDCETEVGSLSFDLTQAESSLNEITAQLSQLETEYDAAAHQRAQTTLVQARDRATQLATQLEHLREQFAQLQARLASLDQVRERRQHELAARAKAEKLKELADFIRDILQKAAPYITETWLLSISHEANQMFREITGRYDVTLRWTKDYEITLEEEGRERPFANLSGGEQMAAALAVRLALLRQLSEINIAFFDEPTTNMDEERRRNLAQQIGRIKAFEQLFVISHDDSFESYTDQVIALEAKEEG